MLTAQRSRLPCATPAAVATAESPPSPPPPARPGGPHERIRILVGCPRHPSAPGGGMTIELHIPTPARLNVRYTSRPGAPKPTVSPNQPRPRGDDGARNALLGYFFQFVATAATQISPIDRDAEGNESWAMVEEYGQDGATASASTIRLIQSKYSETESEIQPKEFSEILAGLARSAQRLPQPPGTTVQWVLLTNRPLSRESEHLYRDGELSPSGEGVSQEHIQTILGHRERLDYERVTLEQATEKLAARARQFGEIDTSRVADNVFTLLRKITLQPQRTRRLRMEDLDAAIAGRPNPQVLFGPNSYARRRDDLATRAEDQRGVRIEDAIPRRAIERIFGMEDDALFVITGLGGSGKTLSLLKAMHGWSGEGGPLCGAMGPGLDLGKQALDKMIADWRGTSADTPESIAEALERIRVASPGDCRFIFALGLDGIDETPQPDHVASAIVRYFHKLHQQPQIQRMRLIVTCRAMRSVDAITRGPGVGAENARLIQAVELGDFVDEELREVWPRWFSEPAPDELFEDPRETGEERETRERLRALRHPVVLGCVREEELSRAERQDLLRGDRDVWDRVLARYVDWFCAKVERRRGRSQAEVKSVLRAAAQASAEARSREGFDMREHWMIPAADWVRTLGQHVLEEIFEDAATAGLIKRDDSNAGPVRGPLTWNWQLPATWAYLRRLNGRG
jgi:hypothetical protein